LSRQYIKSVRTIGKYWSVDIVMSFIVYYNARLVHDFRLTTYCRWYFSRAILSSPVYISSTLETTRQKYRLFFINFYLNICKRYRLKTILIFIIILELQNRTISLFVWFPLTRPLVHIKQRKYILFCIYSFFVIFA